MRAVGLISEYNPFHNGHRYHLEQSLRLSSSQVSVAVMSGHFLQRGEPALVDKWTRTRMALSAGVDVVIELPLPWACNSAPHFASGAVTALASLGVPALCFGSEAGEVASLQECADLLEAHAAVIDQETAALLRQGMHYPDARAEVVGHLGGESLAKLLHAPNNILGIAYLRAIRRLALPLEAFTMMRLGPGYHETRSEGGIASATGIRTRLVSGDEVTSLIPEAAWPFLRQALENGAQVDLQLFYRLLLAAILRGSEGCYLVEHGMAQRLLQACEQSHDLESLLSAIQAPQWTRTRVQRTLCHVLLGSSAEEYGEFLDSGPLYLHLLGASERGRKFLAATRKDRNLPLIDNYSRVYARLRRFYGKVSRKSRLAEAQLSAEINATRLYGLLQKSRVAGGWSRDFSEDVLKPGTLESDATWTG